ncbi:MAG: hypothetical protein CVV34_02375 [Methanomicrobiales archaeon HGW-Methanomicrobiales-5]|nr:MAG: hypothetical protein CVV34_02375 [Methanomicrobiales archaeon HGW-Methanomicrobiales-5]
MIGARLSGLWLIKKLPDDPVLFNNNRRLERQGSPCLHVTAAFRIHDVDQYTELLLLSPLFHPLLSGCVQVIRRFIFPGYPA